MLRQFWQAQGIRLERHERYEEVLKIKGKQGKHRTGEGTRATQSLCFPLHLHSVVLIVSNLSNLSKQFYILLSSNH